MPLFSKRFYPILIESSWKALINLLPIFIHNNTFGLEIDFSYEENQTIKQENHNYSRGYESENEDEKYGLEGLIMELLTYLTYLFENDKNKKKFKSEYFIFLLCIKNFCILSNQTILTWRQDKNLFVEEEYQEENNDSLRNQANNLIKKITKSLDSETLLNFIKIIIAELQGGLHQNVYNDLLKLENFNNMQILLFDRVNNNEENIIYKIFEGNLYIIGGLAENLLHLKNKEKISADDIKEIMKFLYNLINTPNKQNDLIIGRSIWCIGKLTDIFKTDIVILSDIFEFITFCLNKVDYDLSVRLIATKVLSKVSENIKLLLNNNDNIASKNEFDSKLLLENYDSIINLLNITSEENFIILIEALITLAKLNIKKSAYIPLNKNSLTRFVKTFLLYYNHPIIGIKILELMNIWVCEVEVEKVILRLSLSLSIPVFDEIFKNDFDKIYSDIRSSINFQISLEANLDYEPNLNILEVNNFILYNRFYFKFLLTA